MNGITIYIILKNDGRECKYLIITICYCNEQYRKDKESGGWK